MSASKRRWITNSVSGRRCRPDRLRWRNLYGYHCTAAAVCQINFFALLFCTIFLPIALVYIFFYLIWGFVLCMAIWLTWNRKPVLFVYSNSPIWKDYIETEIIPEL